jgi:hypothetical protein
MIQLFSLAAAANLESREVASGRIFELRNAVNDVELVELLDRSGGTCRACKTCSNPICRGRLKRCARDQRRNRADALRFSSASGDAGSALSGRSW